jgi:hypothetical protein
MKVSEIIWDILEIKHAIEDDSDIEELWILQKINAYRGLLIQQEFALTNSINPIWLQRVPKFKLTKCTSADDPSITYSSVFLSKGTLPKVISLSEDLGTYRISGSGAITQLEPCDFNTLLMRIEIGELPNGNYGYYSKIGQNIYIWPLMMEASAIIIAENPFNIQVQENGILRDMTFEDDYPLDISLAQKAILEILTKDFAISEGSIPDIINDSQRQFKILKSEMPGKVVGND